MQLQLFTHYQCKILSSRQVAIKITANQCMKYLYRNNSKSMHEIFIQRCLSIFSIYSVHSTIAEQGVNSANETYNKGHS